MMRILTTILILSASCAHADFSSLDATRASLVNTFTTLAEDGWGSGWSSSHSAVAIADTARTIEQFNDGYKIAYVDGANRTQYKTTEEVDNSIDDLVGAIELDLFGNLEIGPLGPETKVHTGIIGGQVDHLVSETNRVNRYIRRTCNINENCVDIANYEIGKYLTPIIGTINNTVDQVKPIYEDLTAVAATNQDYTTANWHIDGTVQGGFSKQDRPDSDYRLPFGNSKIYGHAGYTAWALGEPVSFYYPDSTDHVSTWRRSDWEAVPSTNPAYADILRLQPREGTRLSIEKWQNGNYATYRIDYDSNGNQISKRQIGTATKNFAAMHSNVENKYIDRVVPTWDRWDSGSWTHVAGTDGYEYGEGSGTGHIEWNDELQAFRGTYTTSGGSVLNIEDNADKNVVLDAIRDHVDTWG